MGNVLELELGNKRLKSSGDKFYWKVDLDGSKTIKSEVDVKIIDGFSGYDGKCHEICIDPHNYNRALSEDEAGRFYGEEFEGINILGLEVVEAKKIKPSVLLTLNSLLTDDNIKIGNTEANCMERFYLRPKCKKYQRFLFAANNCDMMRYEVRSNDNPTNQFNHIIYKFIPRVFVEKDDKSGSKHDFHFII